MTVYIVGTFITCITMYFAQFFYKKYINSKTKDKNFKMFLTFLFLSFLPLSLISGLRYGVGTDYFYTYYPRFYKIMGGSYDVYKNEPLFTYLNRFIQLFTSDVTWLFIVTSFVFNIFLILSIKRMSSNWTISALMIVLGNFFFISMNNVRQCCAMSIATYAFSYACDRKWVRCIIFGLLAIAFHLTSVIFIPIYIFSSIRCIRKYYTYIAIGLVAAAPFCLELIIWIIEHTRFSSYLKYNLNNPIYPYMIVHGVVFLLMFIFREKIVNRNNYIFSLLFLNELTFLIALASLQIPINETMSRACLFFSWSIIFIIPEILLIFNKKYLSVCILIMVLIVITGCTWYASVFLGHHEVFPYVSIFGAYK